MNAFESLYNSVGKKYGAGILYKDTSMFMRILNIFVCLFNPYFMSRYITTVGKRIYFPSRQWVESNPATAAEVLSHELVHISDNIDVDKRYFYGVFGIAYLFPQILAVFSLLSFFAFFSYSWLFCLLFLAFLFPIPAPFRFWAEARGYAMNMFYTSLELGQSYKPWEQADFLSGYFTSWDYYKMWPFKLSVTAKLMVNYLHLPNQNPVFTDVQNWFYSYYGKVPR